MTEIRPYRRLTDRVDARRFQPRRVDRAVVKRIRVRCGEMRSFADREITRHAELLRERVASERSNLNVEIVVEASALVREAATRTLGLTHYDEQLLAGLALATGSIAEMQTGEGKSLTSTLPAVLHALTGRGVHVATVNAYLAHRDYRLLRPVYEMLALSVGHAGDGDPPAAKKQAYACDITYATGYELGFDYLRDQVALRTFNRQRVGHRVRSGLRGTEPQSPTVQREHAFVIIDEVDSVLLDEANTPLILSAPSENSRSSDAAYHQANAVINLLIRDMDYLCKPNERSIRLTETGAGKIHAQIPSDPNTLARPWSMYVEQALRANILYEKDVHYVIRDDQVMIVDEYTGRIFADRSWRDGLHQAVEAKEGVPITDEKRSIARISRQRYFQMYDRICGMTGTASGHEREFYRFYGLPIVSIPLRKAGRRQVAPTPYFATAEQKWQAIARDIATRHHSGQPVLVGTRTIANSRQLASLLTRVGVPFRLLNGLQDEDEAALVAVAGEVGAVTIATNMAGRGTDIKPSPAALQRGGLHVIAAERHDSQRVDRQLIGRAARQGDPGSCQFFVSAEDQLATGQDSKLTSLIRKTCPDGQPSRDCDEAIRKLQIRAERESYQRRIALLNQELWLDKLRASVA